MKVIEGSYFQKRPPPLVLKYSNLLSEIRELFAIWTPSRQILDLSSEKYSDLELVFDPIQSRAIWTHEPLPTYGHLLVEVITATSKKPCYDYLRHCCVDFKQPNTYW